MDKKTLYEAAKKTVSDKYVLGIGALAAATNILGFCDFDGTGFFFDSLPYYDALMHGSANTAFAYTATKFTQNAEIPISKGDIIAGALAIGLGWEVLEHYLNVSGIACLDETGLTKDTFQDLIADVTGAYIGASIAEDQKYEYRTSNIPADTKLLP